MRDYTFGKITFYKLLLKFEVMSSNFKHVVEFLGRRGK